MKIEQVVAKKLILGQKTLTLAESCTGGLIGHRLTSISGSSQFLKIGIVTYSNEAKIKFLKVPPATIKKYGAVSAQTAKAMARGALNLLKTNYALSVTGIAGPTGATKAKPLGLTYMATACKEKTIVRKFILKGTRRQIKVQASEKALSLLKKLI
ncbi:MAG: CinA family protein [Candidatus Aceula meridiana]|nr:CinA family protein [Candidatus Aceula meridiana]